MRLPLNAHAGMAVLLQHFNDLIGNCADMTIDVTRGDYHGVCECRLSCQINYDRLFGLCVLKCFKDAGQHVAPFNRLGGKGGGPGLRCRGTRNLLCQCRHLRGFIPVSGQINDA